MANDRLKHAVGVFPRRHNAEQALNQLHRSGFPMDKVSIIARDADRQDDIAGVDVSDHVGNKADEGAASGALTGGTLGGITGLLVGVGALAIPGVGPVVLAGEVATALATTLAGTAIGAAAGGLLGALIGLGIPEERARVYSDRVSKGDYLVIIKGTDIEIAGAEVILNSHSIQDWGIYNPPGVNSVHTDYAIRPMGGITGMPVSHTLATAPAPTDDAPLLVNRTSGMALSQQKRAVGVFSSRRDVEYALSELRDAGFPMAKVSVIAKDADNGGKLAGADMSDDEGNKAEEGAASGAVTGGVLGTLTGLLVGLGALAIPGIGPVMLAGATATALATTFSGGAIGIATGTLFGALVGLGIPEKRAVVYSDRLSRGDYLVIVDGTDNEIRHAEAILSNRGIQEWGIYDAPDVTRDRTHPSVSVVDTEPDVIIVNRRERTV
ncbi:MAG TPA: histidine kinase [Cyanobacteria bacterium UBA8543]|nr:histidine kinase [Cyanobacteria bacterium UBA8543]